MYNHNEAHQACHLLRPQLFLCNHPPSLVTSHHQRHHQLLWQVATEIILRDIDRGILHTSSVVVKTQRFKTKTKTPAFKTKTETETPAFKTKTETKTPACKTKTETKTPAFNDQTYERKNYSTTDYGTGKWWTRWTQWRIQGGTQAPPE